METEIASKYSINVKMERENGNTWPEQRKQQQRRRLRRKQPHELGASSTGNRRTSPSGKRSASSAGREDVRRSPFSIVASCSHRDVREASSFSVDDSSHQNAGRSPSSDAASAATGSSTVRSFKRVLSKIPKDEKVFPSKYSYEESLIPTALKDIPIPRDRHDLRVHLEKTGGRDVFGEREAIQNRCHNARGGGGGGDAGGCCTSCGNAIPRNDDNNKYRSRSLFFPNACQTEAFSTSRNVVAKAVTKIDKVGERIYSTLPELIVRRNKLGGCCADCIMCSGEGNLSSLPDSCRCFVHSLKGKSSYSVKTYGGGNDEKDPNDVESLMYNNLSYSYFSSFWPNCRVCPTWAPCRCRPGAEGARIPTSSTSSEADEGKGESESEDLVFEDPVTGEKTTVRRPKSKIRSSVSALESDALPHAASEAKGGAKQKQRSVSKTMAEEQIEAKVDEIAAAVTSYAHEIFMMPEFMAEIVDDIPDPKVFLTEDGQLRTRFSLMQDRIKIENLEVTQPLASAVKSYVESFDEFCEFIEEIPLPQWFLDHDGIVRSGAELLANRTRVHRFVIERVELSPVVKDFASMELISHKLKGLKLVQAVRARRPKLDEEEEEKVSSLEPRTIDPTGFTLETAQFNPGRGGLDPPPQRRASDVPLHELQVCGRHKTRFFRVTRGTLAEANHIWTPELKDKIAFTLRYPMSGPREEDIMELMAKLERSNEGDNPIWKIF